MDERRWTTGMHAPRRSRRVSCHDGSGTTSKDGLGSDTSADCFRGGTQWRRRSSAKRTIESVETLQLASECDPWIRAWARIVPGPRRTTVEVEWTDGGGFDVCTRIDVSRQPSHQLAITVDHLIARSRAFCVLPFVPLSPSSPWKREEVSYPCIAWSIVVHAKLVVGRVQLLIT